MNPLESFAELKAQRVLEMSWDTLIDIDEARRVKAAAVVARFRKKPRLKYFFFGEVIVETVDEARDRLHEDFQCLRHRRH